MNSLWQHQIDAIRAAEIHRDLGLFFEQGTGKTRTLIEIARRRFAKAGRLQKTLIFCPAIVRDNWKNEWKLYSKVSPRDVVVLNGPGKRRVQDFIKAVGPEISEAKIIITNFEAVEMDDLYALFLRWRPEILACDEAQRLKNHRSVRAKKIVALADETQHNYVLTGTPLLKSPADFYMQFRILDRGELFGRNFFAFQSRYFFDDNAAWKGKQSYFPKWKIRPDSYAELQHRVSLKALRVLAKDCLDLPPLIRQTVTVEMSPEQRRMYKEMYNDYVTFLDAHREDSPAVVANLAVVKMLRLQQIVSGFVKDAEGNVHWIKDVPRLKALSELLEDITPEKKVIVWSVFHENYKMIAELCQKLGLKYREIHGGITDKQKQINMQEFREDPEVRVMIANQAAGGVGVNLVEAGVSIYYSKGYKLEDDLQSEKRNHRHGSQMHDRVLRIDMVANGTSDELINEVLTERKNLGDKILNWKDRLCAFE